MTTNSRQYLYGASVRASAQRANKEVRRETDKLACVAWDQARAVVDLPQSPI